MLLGSLSDFPKSCIGSTRKTLGVTKNLQGGYDGQYRCPHSNLGGGREKIAVEGIFDVTHNILSRFKQKKIYLKLFDEVLV